MITSLIMLKLKSGLEKKQNKKNNNKKTTDFVSSKVQKWEF